MPQMAEIHRSPDCGNSPKNLFAQEMTVALAIGDPEFLGQRIMEDATWRMAGEGDWAGRAAVLKEVGTVELPASAVLTIHHVMTHGKVGSVTGTILFPEGSAREFCDVYEFSNAKAAAVRRITSYRNEGNRDGS